MQITSKFSTDVILSHPVSNKQGRISLPEHSTTLTFYYSFAKVKAGTSFLKSYHQVSHFK
jgi:hypothetical protein